MKKPFDSETIWIIGASSGIGEALARELSVQGASLILSARSEEPLRHLAADLAPNCINAPIVLPLDVADSQAIQDAAAWIASNGAHLSRVIFMAALYKPIDIAQRDYAFTQELVQVNLLGAIFTTYAVLPIFEAQKNGQIVLCGSVAGYTGLPGGQPYSATKAAIINFAESLYAEMKGSIDVKLISPGFVRTRITDKNNFAMPMRMEPKQAAKAIVRGLNARAFEIHFPKGFTYGVKLLRALPYSLALALTLRMRGKAS